MKSWKWAEFFLIAAGIVLMLRIPLFILAWLSASMLVWALFKFVFLVNVNLLILFPAVLVSTIIIVYFYTHKFRNT